MVEILQSERKYSVNLFQYKTCLTSFSLLDAIQIKVKLVVINIEFNPPIPPLIFREHSP